ncbi:hypothetical protein L6164_021548 [Bauhinia variegata]|uniref:Uncharacterized protein n=1 Tax=Bauhinia variegata TaxID=167791 RepID=A0ACB9MYU6_BAUVA|nr:hypothetical protein L6164_021548 [Bauhinia variegata]
MFERLLKPKFYSKCKTIVKCTRTRLGAIQKKRTSVQKYLKNDIAELLRSGLDINAYGRAEGLLVEQNMSSCYDLLEKFTECISNHLQGLSKKRDCPEECKEAVSSLIYAAARFADLPELRELRTLFTQKFGNSLEPCLSKEFVEKLRQDPPTREMKIQLLIDIAQEFHIEWDSKALEQRLCRVSPLHEERTKHDSPSDSDKEKWHNSHDVAIHETDILVVGSKQGDVRDSKRIEKDLLARGNNDMSESSSDEETSIDLSSQDGPKTCSSFGDSVSEDEVESKRPSSYGLFPPPYLKPKANQDKSSSEKTEDSAALPKKEANPCLVPEKPKPRSVRTRPLKPPPGYDYVPPSRTVSAAKQGSSGMDSEKAKHGQQERAKISDEDDSDFRSDEAKILDGFLTKQSPARGNSLPSEPVTSTKSLENARANSLEPEMLSAERHVHPKLPDYDDLAARISALRGR